MAEADEDPPDAVEQEDGYASPAPSLAQWDSPDISSPVRPGRRSGGGAKAWEDGEDDFDADVLSSPPLHYHRTHQVPSRTGSGSSSGTVTIERAVTRALPLLPLRAPCFGSGSIARASHTTSTSTSASYTSSRNRTKEGRQREREEAGRGPDLRETFDDWDEVTSGGEDCDAFAEREDGLGSTASSTPGPVTPADDDKCMDDTDDMRREVGGEDEDANEDVRAAAAGSSNEGNSEELEDWAEDDAAAMARNANARVAHGWWAKWARSGPSSNSASSSSTRRAQGAGGRGGGGARGGNDRTRHQHQLRRRETTITPDGRQRPLGAAAAAAAAGATGFATPQGTGSTRLLRGPHSAPQVAKRKSQGLMSHEEEDLRSAGRTRLAFTTEDVRTTPKAGGANASSRPGSASGRSRAKEAQAALVSSRNGGGGGSSGDTTGSSRLAQFRWTPACR
ncbi:hypothetical protein BV20DRAFT_1035799 [Pilatotrama ljubarskyi]|nr:hypothetical protein BV20DRAFT_1035799 [Pilatotrama ljubarskyi]